MSRNVMERALWQLCVERVAKERFRQDAVGFLGRFALEEAEVRITAELDGRPRSHTHPDGGRPARLVRRR